MTTSLTTPMTNAQCPWQTHKDLPPVVSGATMPICLVGLGSNVGDRQQALDRAVGLLGRRPEIRLIAQSPWRQTEPIGGPPGQGAFLNGVVLLETSLGPEAVLALLQSIEGELGRQRGDRWGPRTIDLDLLLYDQVVLEAPGLTIPHPRMAFRRFVLEPAAEVAPAMLHPTTGWTVAQLLAHLNTALPYVAVTGPAGAGRRELARRIARKTDARLIAEPPTPWWKGSAGADRSGDAWRMEIELLCERARLLATDLPAWRARDRLAISDFWLAQSLAYARVRLAPAENESFRRRWEELAPTAARPRLTVMLDGPTEWLVARVRARGRLEESCVDGALIDRLREGMLELLRQPGQGPVLYLAHEGPVPVEDEVLAAVQSMK